MDPCVGGVLTGCRRVAPWTTTEGGHVVTQGDASPVALTHRNGTIPFRRNWAVAEWRGGAPREDRRGGQARMGLAVEEALELPGLAGTTVTAGAAGLARVVRHMVVDDPA